ncbi:MAG: 23S rRNA (uracil(1939)-C(5))-methyltransferase RlmD [Filifactor alocis]|nr:23S rRNA (uracil(1939)-C(5))-methyltransferase RlmD [Filifactor alocis]
MKKKEVVVLEFQEFDLDGTSKAHCESKTITAKHAIPGQVAKVYIKKLRGNKGEGRVMEVVHKSPLETEEVCAHFDVCGGCSLLPVAYKEQLELKRKALIRRFEQKGHEEFSDLEIVGSPEPREYKNKMEFTFGNEEKDGPLTLGMHMTTRSNSIVFVEDCRIIDEDYRRILKLTKEHFEEEGLPFYHIMRREGCLRHLVLRKGKNTGEILVNLVTTTQKELDTSTYVQKLKSLELDGKIEGVLHTYNDSFSDAVVPEKVEVLHGSPIFKDKLLGKEFRISPFSFFQTNTRGAEVLYATLRKMVEEVLIGKEEETVFDLYSGTGTIGILLSDVAKHITSIEIVEEAVDMARENAVLNGVDNVRFIAGDVAKEVGKLEEKPYLIILDPPRSGIHPKAMGDILSFEAENIVYVSCNPKVFADELQTFKNAGYNIVKSTAVDQFPNTNHVEMIVLMSKER